MPARPPSEAIDLDLIPELPAHEQTRLKRLLERRAQLHGVRLPSKPWPTDEPLELLRQVAPLFTTSDFAAHHVEFWDWVWGVEPGVRPQPLVFIVNRGGAKSVSSELAAILLGATGRRKYILYTSGTQEQADDHVSSVAAVLESPEMERAFPAMSRRMIGRYGNSRGWRRNRLRTDAGVTIDAIGLVDSARGARMEEQRPDLIIFDDVDAAADSQTVVENKLRAIRTSIIPAGSPDVALLFVQNLIHPNSIARRITDPTLFPAEERLLLDRKLIGPIPAVEGLDVEQRKLPDGTFRYDISRGKATWGGLPLGRCEEIINATGLRIFLREYQHDVSDEPGGLFSHITWRRIPWDEIPWSQIVDTQVWVDPAVTAKDDSDCCGITAACVDEAGFIYVLWSMERRMPPRVAIETAATVAVKLGASTVGCETDQGGDTWLVVWDKAVENLVRTRKITDEQASRLRFAQEKAGSYGSKVERASGMEPEYARGLILHAVSPAETHLSLERALFRFPKTPPLDGVDSLAWAWRAMRRMRPAPALGEDYRRLLTSSTAWSMPAGGNAAPALEGGWAMDSGKGQDQPAVAPNEALTFGAGGVDLLGGENRSGWRQ